MLSGGPDDLEVVVIGAGAAMRLAAANVSFIASFGRYPDCRRHAGLKQKVRVGRGDDDTGGGINNQDARIIHTPIRSGAFHIEATHFSDVMDPIINAFGNFTLIVRRIR